MPETKGKTRQRNHRVTDLKTIPGVVTELGKVYRALRRNELDRDDAKVLAGVLTAIRDTLEGADMERRLTALERETGR